MSRAATAVPTSQFSFGDLLFKKDNRNLSPVDLFKLMSLIDVIPNQWRKLVEERGQYKSPELNGMAHLRIEDEDVDLSSVTLKYLYIVFKNAKQTPPSARKRLQDVFPDLQVDWKETYSLTFKVSLETKIRESQNEVLNEKLFSINKVDSPFCTFCKNKIESL